MVSNIDVFPFAALWWRKFRVMGLSTSLDVLELDADNKDRKRKIDGGTYPSIVISQLGMSSSRT